MKRHLGRHKIGISTALAVLMIGLVTVPSSTRLASAAPGRSVALGQMYGSDSLDTRSGARAFNGHMSGTGYGAATATSAQSADQVWADGRDASILYFAGQANAGLLLVRENPNEYIIAGNRLSEGEIPFPTRKWSEYIPYLDVDDVRLAILNGCDTANTLSDPDQADYYGNFFQAGRSVGIDSIVAFSDLVYFPVSCFQAEASGFADQVAVKFGQPDKKHFS